MNRATEINITKRDGTKEPLEVNKMHFMQIGSFIYNNHSIIISQNTFYKNWNSNTQNYHLIKYVLPNEDIEDYNIISQDYILVARKY